MEFEWDEAKDVENRAKHGLSLADAAGLDWQGADIVVDARANYAEIRQIAYGNLACRLHTCVFTAREGGRRIISLRKSNQREIRDHGKAITTPPD